jgi:hypothetical protein
MKKITPLILLNFILALAAFANDGVFYASGNTLVPLQETKISLKKEVLKFYIHDYSWMRVEVDFEFYNPGAARKLTVGFVAPPGDGDITPEEQSHPQIKDFTVAVNGANLNYDVKRIREKKFKLTSFETNQNDFVFHFPATFKKGLNRVRHTYIFRGGGSVELERVFDYVITTGKTWANKQIDDFELQLHLDNGIYAIPAGFSKSGTGAKWQIIGDGVLDNKTQKLFEVDEAQVSRMVHLNSGYLVLKEKNFRPQSEITIAEYNTAAGWITRWCKDEKKCPDADEKRNLLAHLSVDARFNPEWEDVKELTGDDFKIMRNFPYAIRGLQFKDKFLVDFYSQFFWYKPNPSATTDNIKLSAQERKFLADIKDYQSKNK